MGDSSTPVIELHIIKPSTPPNSSVCDIVNIIADRTKLWHTQIEEVVGISLAPQDADVQPVRFTRKLRRFTLILMIDLYAGQLP